MANLYRSIRHTLVEVFHAERGRGALMARQGEAVIILGTPSEAMLEEAGLRYRHVYTDARVAIAKPDRMIAGPDGVPHHWASLDPIAEAKAFEMYGRACLAHYQSTVHGGR